MKKLKKIEKEIDRLKVLRDDNHWDSVRNPKNFMFTKKSTSAGERVVLVPRSDIHNKDLQSSRSIGLTDIETFKDLEIGFDEGMTLTKDDNKRIVDLEESIEEYNKFCAGDGLEKFTLKGFCEIGFRYPRLMSYYHDKYSIPVTGYDISTLAVEFAKMKGWDARECDILREDIDLSSSNLVIAYHVLEHLRDPESVIQKIFDSVKTMTICHFEVPIEMNEPKFDYGHLFGFHPGDLYSFMTSAGFSILSQTYRNIGGVAVWTERIAGIKIP